MLNELRHNQGRCQAGSFRGVPAAVLRLEALPSRLRTMIFVQMHSRFDQTLVALVSDEASTIGVYRFFPTLTADW